MFICRKWLVCVYAFASDDHWAHSTWLPLRCSHACRTPCVWSSSVLSFSCRFHRMMSDLTHFWISCGVPSEREHPWCHWTPLWIWEDTHIFYDSHHCLFGNTHSFFSKLSYLSEADGIVDNPYRFAFSSCRCYSTDQLGTNTRMCRCDQ